MTLYFKKALLPTMMSAVFLTGCASTVNTAGSDLYACPGMPSGVLCKTPGAVYKSTNRDIPDTAFDTPIQQLDSVIATFGDPSAKPVPIIPDNLVVSKSHAGPKPVREPAKVVRIWIAPWVDDQDGLHLAQVNYVEVSPRTWTVGKAASPPGSSYVIPHMAYQDIDPVLDAATTNNPAVSGRAGVDPTNPAINAGTLIQPQIEPVQ